MRVKSFFKSLILILLAALLTVQTAQFMLSSMLVTDGEDTGLKDVLSNIGLEWIARFFPSTTTYSDQPFSPERFLYPYAISVQTGDKSYAAFAHGSTLIAFCRDIVQKLMPVMVLSDPANSEVPFSQAIRQDGILMDLGRALSNGEVTAALDGTKIDGGDFFRYCFFSKDQEGFHIYLKNEQTGRTLVYTSKDSKYSENLMGLLQSAPKLSSFMEMHVTDTKQAYGVLLSTGELYPDDRNFELSSLWYSNPLYSTNGYNTQVLTSLFSSLGSSYGSPRHTARKNGAVDYIENEYTITIYPSGEFHYASTKTSSGIPINSYVSERQDFKFSLPDVLTAAQVFIDSLDKSAVGGQDAELRFKSCTMGPEASDSGNRSVIIEFDYCVDGLPIVVSGQSYGAKIEYNSGYFTDIDLNCREYSKSSQMLPIADLRTSLAFGSLRGIKNVGHFEVGYYDVGEPSMNPNYILFDLKKE